MLHFTLHLIFFESRPDAQLEKVFSQYRWSACGDAPQSRGISGYVASVAKKNTNKCKAPLCVLLFGFFLVVMQNMTCFVNSSCS